MIDKLILVGGFLGGGKTTLLAVVKMCNNRNGAQRNDGSQSRNRKFANLFLRKFNEKNDALAQTDVSATGIDKSLASQTLLSPFFSNLFHSRWV